MDNELIKIEDNGGVLTVNARDLWIGLESRQQFADWIKTRLEGFSEDADYLIHKSMNNPDGGRPVIDYHLTIDTAKHIAMMERNEKGHEFRAYFLQIEKAWNTPELVFARALQAANALLKQNHARIAELEPKAAFFDQVADSKTALQMRDVAATLNIEGVGRNKLFEILRQKKILDDRNIPYRAYQDRGFFRVIEQKWSDDGGEIHINLKPLVYQKGIEFIRKLVLEEV
jgi:anti-repressor protein